jgi:hypothetical protein
MKGEIAYFLSALNAVISMAEGRYICAALFAIATALILVADEG